MIAEQLQAAVVEAKESVDRLYRQEALKYWEKLRRYVEKNPGKIQKLPRHPQFSGFVISPKNLRVAKQYPDLYIVLADGEQRAGMGRPRAGGGRVMVLPVLKAPFDTTYVATRMTGVEKTFLHEFIHYLDQHRYKGKAPESVALLRKHGFAGYYNSPSEFNAYYQEAANEILSTLRTIKKYAEPRKPGSLASFIKDYSTFEKRFLAPPYFEQGFLEAINDKYRKKLLQRLYGLYVEVRKEMG